MEPIKDHHVVRLEVLNPDGGRTVTTAVDHADLAWSGGLGRLIDSVVRGVRSQLGLPVGELTELGGAVVHRCPPGDAALMPCCGRTPFEVPGDRMTTSLALVTCGAVSDHDAERLNRIAGARTYLVAVEALGGPRVVVPRELLRQVLDDGEALIRELATLRRGRTSALAELTGLRQDLIDTDSPTQRCDEIIELLHGPGRD